MEQKQARGIITTETTLIATDAENTNLKKKLFMTLQ